MRLLLLPLVLALAGAGCAVPSLDRPSGDQGPQITLVVDRVERPLRIGVLVTGRSASGEGEQWTPSAAGAQVAAYRLGLGGTEVRLEVAVDLGTAGTARRAVASLLDQHVAGIVVATSGDHLRPALWTARKAGTPVLMPYHRTRRTLPGGVWTTGPSAVAVGWRLRDAMSWNGLSRPFVVTADGITARGVPAARSEHLRRNRRNLAGVLDQVDRAYRRRSVDSVVLAASATTQARLVRSLRGVHPELPVLLTPEALRPELTRRLAASPAVDTEGLVTVGADASDTTTLARESRASRVRSYFAALRLMVADEDVTDLFGRDRFAEVTAGADTASHDAVLALATAASEAGSVEAADVLTALSRIRVDATDGLAGPDLDFTTSEALAAADVVPLHLTTQDPGVRPPAPNGEHPGLYWFAAPVRRG